MWTTIIAVSCVVAMIVGPIMMLQPSRQQRRIARVRTLAAKQGLRVRLGQNPTSGEPRHMAIYCRAIEDLKSTAEKIQPWCVSRQSLEHELNFVNDWDWVANTQASEALQKILPQWLSDLPAPIRAVEVSGHSVCLYWTEACWHKGADVEDSLQKCVEFIDAELQWLIAQL